MPPAATVRAPDTEECLLDDSVGDAECAGQNYIINARTECDRTRAGALAVLFGSPPAGLSRPAALICAAYPDASPHRVHETLEPLAAKLGQPILTLGRRDEPQAAVAAACAAGPQAVLLCWDHANIPALAAGVPTTDSVPSSWPEDRFDLIWIFEHWDGANYRFRIADQAVLSPT